MGANGVDLGENGTEFENNDNGVDLGENGTEFENNDFGEKDVSVTFMRSDYAAEEGILEVLKQVVLQIVYSRDGTPFFRRTKQAFIENGPLVKQAVTNSTKNLMDWTHRGGPWRAFLVISVGTILLLAMTGFGAFMLFFLAATTNTIIVGLLMSLAAVGGFMAIFFTCLVAIFVGALSVAAFVISVTTLVTITAVSIAAGWIGFFWLVWQGIKKSLDVTRSSFLITASALSSISTNGPISKIKRNN